MKKLVYLMLSLLLFIGCEPNDVVEDYHLIQEDVTSEELNNVDGELLTIQYAGTDLTVTETDSVYIFEGDIMIPKEDSKYFNKSAAIGAEDWWEDNVIYYSINSNLSNNTRVEIADAILHWELNTNLIFVERTNQQDYVYFTAGSGCSSFVGKRGGAQSITLSEACSTGNIVHEIGHAAGLWHEQSRADRDDYIIVHMENVASGTEHNFSKYWNGVDLTPTLDFGSIMMYSSYSFSKNGLPTITKLDGSTYNVQRSGLSAGDLYGIDIMYPDSTITPNPDRDGDGVLNEDDDCPDEAVEPMGEYVNEGCPWVDGEYYLIYDVWVKRVGDTWMYWSRQYGEWKEVYLRFGQYWYYVK